MKTECLDAISRLRLIDDDFMRIVFKDKDCLTHLLERPIKIIEWHTQYDINNILGRAICIDALVKDKEHYINIEVQKKKQVHILNEQDFMKV